MPFVKIPGFEGKIYVPEEKPGRAKKHNCTDCHYCQMCGDERCRVCHDGNRGAGERHEKRD